MIKYSKLKKALPLKDRVSTAHPQRTCIGALPLAGPGLPQSCCDWNLKQTTSPKIV